MNFRWADYDESWNSWEPKLCFEPWTTDYDKTINKLLSNDLNLIHPNILDEQAATLNEIARKKFKRKKEAQALAKLNAKAKGKEVASKKQVSKSFVVVFFSTSSKSLNFHFHFFHLFL